MQALCVHQVGLSCGDLWSGHTMKGTGGFHLNPQRRSGQEVGTHNDDGAGDGDGSHASVRDGVSPVGIADALVIAVDSSLVRSEHQCQDG